MKFTHPGAVRYVYYAILADARRAGGHGAVLGDLADLLRLARDWVAAGAGLTADEQDDVGRLSSQAHRRLARWTYPIWLYVSVTGVVVYVMLYHLWPPAACDLQYDEQGSHLPMGEGRVRVP